MQETHLTNPIASDFRLKIVLRVLVQIRLLQSRIILLLPLMERLRAFLHWYPLQGLETDQ